MVAFIALPHLIPDVRTKTNKESCFILLRYFALQVSDFKLILGWRYWINCERHEGTPTLHYCGMWKNVLLIDCKKIVQVKISEIHTVLISAYFTFNIWYVKQWNNTFSFLEILLMDTDKASKVQATPAIKHFMMYLSNHWQHSCVVAKNHLSIILFYCCLLTTLLLYHG